MQSKQLILLHGCTLGCLNQQLDRTANLGWTFAPHHPAVQVTFHNPKRRVSFDDPPGLPIDDLGLDLGELAFDQNVDSDLLDCADYALGRSNRAWMRIDHCSNYRVGDFGRLQSLQPRETGIKVRFLSSVNLIDDHIIR
jgi:hypothetical protein